jgi:hypothetical protein
VITLVRVCARFDNGELAERPDGYALLLSATALQPHRARQDGWRDDSIRS